MKKAMLVHVGQSQQSLIHDALNLVLREISGPVLHKLVNILLHVLKDKVEIVVHSDDLFQFHDVYVVQLPQRLNLSQSHALVPRIKFLLHLLNRNYFVALLVLSLDD